MGSKNMIMWLGVILVIVGIIGFFANPLLGLFEVNAMHNLVHIITGVLAIVFAMTSESAAKNFAKVFGIIYGLVAILGIFSGSGMVLGIALNGADNVLHIILALIFLYLGFSSSERSMAM